MWKLYYIYILASRTRALYVGVTNDLARRMRQHRSGTGSRHARKYHEFRLVYFEEWGQISLAIAREKEIKGWRRSRKIRLIGSKNPDWRDLAESPAAARST